MNKIKITPADTARVLAYWKLHPYIKTADVAAACGVDARYPIKAYPFTRTGASFRVDQALRWFQENCGNFVGRGDDDIGNDKLRKLYGFSGGVLAEARGIRKVAAMKRLTVVQAVVYVKSSPEGKNTMEAVLKGALIPNLSHTPEQVAERQNTPVVAKPVEETGAEKAKRVLPKYLAAIRAVTDEEKEGGGQRDDDGKPRHDLIAPEMFDGVAAVLAFGVKKYGERDWEKGLQWGNTLASTMRHLMAWMRREELDEESGLPHLDHAACNIMFLCAFARRGTGTDNRG
jgi:hypothetical protein